MTRASVEQEIRTIVAAKASRDPARIGRDEDFEEDLGLDSLDRLDLLAAVEDELGIRISEDRAAEVRTLAALLEVAGAAARQVAL
jgi:acyl carrier protein